MDALFGLTGLGSHFGFAGWLDPGAAGLSGLSHKEVGPSFGHPAIICHMADLEDVRRICRNLPDTAEGDGAQFGFGVMVKGKSKGFVWSWGERIDPKKARVPNEGVLAVRVPGLAAKQVILDSDPAKFFTEDHYNNYPAVLVRLDQIGLDELEDLIIEAWKCCAPAALIKAWESGSL